MQIFQDTIHFLKTLSFTDYIFFFAVLALMLLIITLIYFIFDNKVDDNDYPSSVDKEKKDIDISHFDEEDAITDLREITEAIDKASENNVVNLNDYESEQEEKAIISYDELLKRKKAYALNYSEEENLEQDLIVKKVDLNHLVNEDMPIEPNIKVTVISYKKEEAFLEALKTLQKTLN